ncbi:hypothetical protein HPB51_005738 [Rhipicephalus microplus]|uniref:CCHC-type domain-containing protein n=1 Tax=Rhipicephalus microplus TaxID=6941 RepID=A0A9J6E0D4_RHIMP|nr:hypothetical protein HPB51_005738 [Rhipicephalus microplus]
MPGVADSRTDPLQQHHHTFSGDVTHDQPAYRGTTTNRHLEDCVYYLQRPRATYPEVYIVSPPSPICCSCGAIGHISSFCRRRRQTRYGPPPTWSNFEGVNDDHWPTEHRATNATRSPPRNSFHHSKKKSDTPASDRSLTPLTSQSLMPFTISTATTYATISIEKQPARPMEIRRLQGHANTIRAPVRLQAGPPGPFKSTKQRGAVLTLTCRAWASKMQRPARHSTPTTTDAQSPQADNNTATGKPAVAPTLAKALAQGTPSDVFENLKSLYLPPPLTPSYPDYCGEANPNLDHPFTLRELEAALATQSTRLAPGEDEITYCYAYEGFIRSRRNGRLDGIPQ